MKLGEEAPLLYNSNVYALRLIAEFEELKNSNALSFAEPSMYSEIKISVQALAGAVTLIKQVVVCVSLP